MHKKDYIAQMMAIYKQLESDDEQLGPEVEIRLKEPERDWTDLVDEATHYGMDFMEVNDLVRMANYAKYILR